MHTVIFLIMETNDKPGRWFHYMFQIKTIRFFYSTHSIALRRFARDVVNDAVDELHFVHDTGTDGLQHFPRDASEVTRHTVDTCYGTDTNCSRTFHRLHSH